MNLQKLHLSPGAYRNPVVLQMKPTYIQTTNHCIIPFGVEKGILGGHTCLSHKDSEFP